MIAVDELPISSLADRYQISRSLIFKRIKALKQRDPTLATHMRGRKGFVNARLLEYLDALAGRITAGETVEEAADSVLRIVDKPTPVDRPVNSRVDGLAEQPGQYLAPSVSLPFDFESLLQRLRGLQECSDRGWCLSSSQLKAVLGRRSLPTSEFGQQGFKFRSVGKQGGQRIWQISPARTLECHEAEAPSQSPHGLPSPFST